MLIEKSEFIPRPEEIIAARYALHHDKPTKAFGYIQKIEQLFDNELTEIQEGDDEVQKQCVLGAFRMLVIGNAAEAEGTFWAPIAYDSLDSAVAAHESYRKPVIITMAKQTNTKVGGEYCNFHLEMQLDTVAILFLFSKLLNDPQPALSAFRIIEDMRPYILTPTEQTIFDQATHFAKKEKQRIDSNSETIRQTIWRKTSRFVPQETVTAVNEARDRYVQIYTA
ncbi:MAG TPA: hypothetical protein VLF89_03255 [Candidatus Saccharimonadales bacterium]|nr:hypothetical protein [Candidatus Saccharimonadales bacterium]